MEPGIYTADEAAAYMRLSKRGLIKLAKKHGACSVVGRTFLFTQANLDFLLEVTRAVPTVRKPSVVPTLSDHQLRKSLEKLTTKKKSPGRLRWEAAVARNKTARGEADYG